MTEKCVLCDEKFSFMELHSSAGTITKDPGCMMYEELLQLKEKLFQAENSYLRICLITQHLKPEQLPEHYEEIQKRRKIRNDMKRRIDFIENDYLKNFCSSTDPILVARRKKIEEKVDIT